MMTSATGEQACAVDEPTAVEWMPRGSAVQCGQKCIVTPFCIIYNFNELFGKCDTYCYKPENYSVVPGCVGYGVQCK